MEETLLNMAFGWFAGSRTFFLVGGYLSGDTDTLPAFRVIVYMMVLELIMLAALISGPVDNEQKP